MECMTHICTKHKSEHCNEQGAKHTAFLNMKNDSQIRISSMVSRHKTQYGRWKKIASNILQRKSSQFLKSGVYMLGEVKLIQKKFHLNTHTQNNF